MSEDVLCGVLHGFSEHPLTIKGLIEFLQTLPMDVTVKISSEPDEYKARDISFAYNHGHNVLVLTSS